MRVLVVGIGNNAADASTQLIGHVRKIYLSHRGGVKIVIVPTAIEFSIINQHQVPRISQGVPFDFGLTGQLNLVVFALDKYAPRLSSWLLDYGFEKMMKKVI
jgi:dimethylaniline monooxygenase (N-oxide forming) / hypotaurine monooxygenase